jgi:hypothetical protein
VCAHEAFGSGGFMADVVHVRGSYKNVRAKCVRSAGRLE